MKIVGVDLAGKSENPTGICIIQDDKIETKILYSDQEIMEEIQRIRPDCVAIDAPLWMPRNGIWRPGELQLIKMGFRPVSAVFPTMRLLHLRASGLSKKLMEKGFKYIEVMSKISEQIMGLSKEPKSNKDEYDALVSALTAKSYLENKYEDLSGIIIPKV